MSAHERRKPPLLPAAAAAAADGEGDENMESMVEASEENPSKEEKGDVWFRALWRGGSGSRSMSAQLPAEMNSTPSPTHAPTRPDRHATQQQRQQESDRDLRPRASPPLKQAGRQPSTHDATARNTIRPHLHIKHDKPATQSRQCSGRAKLMAKPRSNSCLAMARKGFTCPRQGIETNKT